MAMSLRYDRCMSELSGRVLAIHITAEAEGDLHPVESIRAHPGRGLEGDRYFNQVGTFAKPGKTLHRSQEATLIEIEALESLQRECGLSVSPSQSRRNILTQGIALNDLLGHEFTVGGVRMKGVKLCHPCDYLESRTHAGVKAGLENRGGLRAQILTEGVINVGDSITAAVSRSPAKAGVGAGA
jgi:MOSC domain-containing protein YiiM